MRAPGAAPVVETLNVGPIDPSRFPRPNPGPEPWPVAAGPGWTGLALALAAVPTLALLAILARRMRLRRPHAASAGPDDPPTEPADDRRRLIALADEVRAALADRFGPAWGSRTTEEVAADPGLAGLVGADSAGPLVALLRDADRVKFAGAEPAGDWAGWAAAFLAAAGAGATSRITGR